MRGKRSAFAIAGVAATCLFLHAPAGAAADIQQVLQDDGEGLMNANGPINPAGQTWAWEVCPEDGSPCSPFASGRSITTAGAPPDAFFRATSSLGFVFSTRVWRGTVTGQGPPSVSGPVRANELVTPLAGFWQGGWDGDYDQFQLAACTDAGGTDCSSLTHAHYPRACPGGAAVIDRRFTGLYLRVADRRLGPDSVFPAYAVTTPYGHPAWQPNRITSVAMLGRIAPAAGPRAASCGPPELRKPRATIDRRGFASVRCEWFCRAVLNARHGRKVRRIASSLRASFSSQRVRLPKGALSGWPAGDVVYVVKIDRRVVAKRTLHHGSRQSPRPE